MTLVVNQIGAREILNKFLNQALSLRLFSNNRTPVVTDVLADYTQVSGGGYAAKSLTFANWTVTAGSPTVALYADFQDFNFTGATAAPGTIYGYYIVDAGNFLVYAERFPADDVPFTPVNGSLIRVRPRITNQNLS